MSSIFLQESRDYQLIEQAIKYLEQNFRKQPGLEEIAAGVHLSKYHFQRLFKRWAGISPTQFVQFLTIEYSKQRLRESHSVFETTLDAGLSGSGRLHDLFVTFEGITPGEYKRLGEGLQLAYGIHNTPFGGCLVATTPRGICGLEFLQNGDATSALERLQKHWPHAEFVENVVETQPVVARIFKSGDLPPTRPFHLLLKGTNFQVKVWQALLTIPAGAMVSYQDVAAYLGTPNATRAVAGAIARNPVGYLIPCHRVISKAGKTHNYQWGEIRKKAILGWEAGLRVQQAGAVPAA